MTVEGNDLVPENKMFKGRTTEVVHGFPCLFVISDRCRFKTRGCVGSSLLYNIIA